MTGFRSEADMLVLLVHHTASLVQRLAGHFRTLFEVQSAAGIPDLVLVAFNDQELANRQRRGLDPVVDIPDVAVMTLLGLDFMRQQRDASSSPAQLAAATGFTAGYLCSTVLPRLADQGHVKRLARGRWASTHALIPLADHVISVETKRTDWRGGFWQANRQAADYTWLVLDFARSAKPITRAEKFLICKVGLATLSVASELKVIVPAYSRKPSSVQRNLLIERTASLFLSGQVSGPINSVFGRELVPTTGADPRLQGAAAR
jgi:hypothetical protein